MHREASWLMEHAHGRLDLVHILPPCPTTSRERYLDIGWIKLDLVARREHGQGLHHHKAGLSVGLGIEGRYAHKPVHARLVLQAPVGAYSCNLKQEVTVATLAVLISVELVYAPALPRCVPLVHAPEHPGEVF